MDTTEASPPCEATVRRLEAEAIVHRNVLWASGAGVMPLPLVDVLAISGVQLKMLRELCARYEREFDEPIAKQAVASLLVGVGGVGVGAALGSSLIKFVPIVGAALGSIGVSIVSGATTHAIGKAFIMHFEAGGTVQDFDAKAMRGYVEREFAEAKAKLAKLGARASPAEA